jgi:uncharacterized protein YqgV (UPF0045/DUF77 family)
MRITAEISLYPLTPDFLPRIESFIRDVEAPGRLEVVVNQMSTQLRGELHDVLAAVERGLARSFADGEPEVLVAKFLNADLPVAQPPDRANAG